MAQARILDVGCGLRKRPGAIGVDRHPASAADVLCDFDRGGLPFADSVFDEVWAVHVLEHVADPVALVEEIWRVSRAAGRVHIVTPHCSDASSFADPTHRHHFNTFSFRFFYPGGVHGADHWYSRARFEERKLRVRLLRLWRWCGLEWLVNTWRPFRNFWEYYLCFVIRGKVMELELEVRKEV